MPQEETSLDIVPGALHASNAEGGEDLKGGRAEVEVSPGAASAAVDKGGVDGFSVVLDADAAAAEGVVVGVAVGRAGVELGLVQGDDVLVVVVSPAACTEACVVPGE